MTYDYDLESLSDSALIAALAKVAQEWVSNRSAEVTDVLMSTAFAEGASFASLPAWLRDPSTAPEAAGAIAKESLEAILNGVDDEAATWAATAVREAAEEATAHLIDPISLGIIGVTLIGVILAARVKKIGKVKFYKGVPKELGSVLGAAVKAVAGGNGTG